MLSGSATLYTCRFGPLRSTRLAVARQSHTTHPAVLGHYVTHTPARRRDIAGCNPRTHGSNRFTQYRGTESRPTRDFSERVSRHVRRRQVVGLRTKIYSTHPKVHACASVDGTCLSFKARALGRPLHGGSGELVMELVPEWTGVSPHVPKAELEVVTLKVMALDDLMKGCLRFHMGEALVRKHHVQLEGFMCTAQGNKQGGMMRHRHLWWMHWSRRWGLRIGGWLTCHAWQNCARGSG